jgi:hypothetical protein
LIHSRTSTLDAALAPLSVRWTHEPGDPDSLARTISDALDRREAWGAAALEGLEFMQGRTIDVMHQKRARFLTQLRQRRASGPLARAEPLGR